MFVLAMKYVFGLQWNVRSTSGGLEGPGPNYFSDSTNNVQVDASGNLRLQVTFTKGKWVCGEIMLAAGSLGYGT